MGKLVDASRARHAMAAAVVALVGCGAQVPTYGSRSYMVDLSGPVQREPAEMATAPTPPIEGTVLAVAGGEPAAVTAAPAEEAVPAPLAEVITRSPTAPPTEPVERRSVIVVPAPPRPRRQVTIRLVVDDADHGGGLFHDGRQVTLDEFLRLSGHADRAAAIRSRRMLRKSLIVGGFGVAAIGGVVALTAGSCQGVLDGDYTAGDDFTGCVNRTHDRRTIGLAAFVTGAVSGLIGLELSSGRPYGFELREYADAYNLKRSRELSLAPVVGRDRVGLALATRF